MPRTAAAERRTRKRRRRTKARPIESFCMVRLREQVHRARPVAYRLLEEGIDYGQRLEDCFMHRVAGFLKDPAFTRFVKTAPDDAFAAWGDRLEAARAIGIALGLMLRPEAFDHAQDRGAARRGAR